MVPDSWLGFGPGRFMKEVHMGNATAFAAGVACALALGAVAFLAWACCVVAREDDERHEEYANGYQRHY